MHNSWPARKVRGRVSPAIIPKILLARTTTDPSIPRGRVKVCVLTEMSLFFLSQINTFNATSSLNKKCNKFMYWIHGQIISCMIIWEPLQRFLFIWNNSFLCFWSLQHLLWSYQWMDAEKRKWVVPKRESSIQRSGFSWKIFLHYWNHFMWKTS